MKKGLASVERLLALVLAAGTLLAARALPAIAETPRPILVTVYRQVGWGDKVQIGYVDEAGGLWYREGNDEQLKWPYDRQEQLAWLEKARGFQPAGTLEREALFELDSLVQCVEQQEGRGASAADDAGTETSYAVRYSARGAELVLLGLSGDIRFENTDPSAQALYLRLRTFFPGVTS